MGSPRLGPALGLGPSLGPPPGPGLALQVGFPRLGPALGLGPRLRPALGLEPSLGPPPWPELALQVGSPRLGPALGLGPRLGNALGLKPRLVLQRLVESGPLPGPPERLSVGAARPHCGVVHRPLVGSPSPLTLTRLYVRVGEGLHVPCCHVPSQESPENPLPTVT